jgi:ligand-binding SRPBCC domain-containing protein
MGYSVRSLQPVTQASPRSYGSLPPYHRFAMLSLEVRNEISASADAVWQRVTTPAGINDEIRPFMRMTMPASMRAKTIADVAPGDDLGRSWLLLFGIVPFDYDDITIAELETGRRFLERSSMLSMRLWQHERIVTATDQGCEVHDRVAFELRNPLCRVPRLERLLRSLLRRLFQHRHHRLARHFTKA